MKRIIFIVLTIFCLTQTSNTLAAVRNLNEECFAGDTCSVSGYSCLPEASSSLYTCQKDDVSKIFGKITPPDALKGFVGKDVSGAAGISTFLSNLITLIYSMAAIALIFMILWGAFEWLTSGGDKEAVAKARGRIINAMIGILIFAAAFAMLQVLGTFTGFQFFSRVKVINDRPGINFQCPDGTFVGGNVGNDPNAACKGHGT